MRALETKHACPAYFLKTHQQVNGGQCMVGVHERVGHLIYAIICFTVSIETNADASAVKRK